MSSRNLFLGILICVASESAALTVENPAASQEATPAASNTEIGRYQLVAQHGAGGGAAHQVTEGGIYLVDTATGDVWRAGAKESFQPVPVPRRK